MLTLRAMEIADLDLVAAWLDEPQVAQWYLTASTVEEEMDDLRRCLVGEEPTEVLVIADHDEPIGWCQWYLCREYPAHAEGIGAGPDDIGIDYAIGDPARWGLGLGTALIDELVSSIRRHHRRAGIVADPEASNVASRRVLEKNGFELLGVRLVASEPSPAPMAIYRLRPEADLDEGG